jgi:hypothetical protein
VTKTLFLSFAWVLLVAGVTLTSVAATQFLTITAPLITDNKDHTDAALITAGSPEVLGASETGMQTYIASADGRAQIVANFLRRYHSPLKPYEYFGEKLVEIADRHGIDFRLLPAIAMQESNLCKAIPEDSYNCLGFGVHSRGTLKFESFEANFERAARELKVNYIDIGLTTPEPKKPTLTFSSLPLVKRKVRNRLGIYLPRHGWHPLQPTEVPNN